MSSASNTGKGARRAWSLASPRVPRKPAGDGAGQSRPRFAAQRSRRASSTPMARRSKSAAAMAPSRPVSAIGNATVAAPIFKPASVADFQHHLAGGFAAGQDI